MPERVGLGSQDICAINRHGSQGSRSASGGVGLASGGVWRPASGGVGLASGGVWRLASGGVGPRTRGAAKEKASLREGGVSVLQQEKGERSSRRRRRG